MRVKLLSNLIFNLGNGKSRTVQKGIYDNSQEPFSKEFMAEIKKGRRVIEVLSGDPSTLDEMNTLESDSGKLETKEKPKVIRRRK